ADHVAGAGRRREDVEAQRLGWGHRCAAVTLFGAQAEGVRADGAILPDHRQSRGGTGWLLDSSGAAERGNRELRCRCGLDCSATGDVDRSERDRRGICRRCMVGGALPELRQPKAGRGLRWAGADALAKRIRRARARRVQSRQSAAADNDDPTCLAVVATSAEFGAGAMVPGTRQTQWTPAQDDDRRAGAQTAGRALEICDRRRRRRRRRDEGCLIDLEEIKYLKRYTPSTETRSVSADPGGRTDGRHGLYSRLQEWARLPETSPPQRGHWCSR